MTESARKTEQTYPGSDMTYGRMLALAHEYRRIALSLDRLEADKRPLLIAPYRFAAIHAIELYFNAFLLFRGLSHVELRRSHHDLKQRQLLAHSNGLMLKATTVSRLEELMLNREYLSARYSITNLINALDFSSLELIMNELAAKVNYKLCNSKEKPRAVS